MCIIQINAFKTTVELVLDLSKKKCLSGLESHPQWLKQRMTGYKRLLRGCSFLPKIIFYKSGASEKKIKVFLSNPHTE